MRIFKRPGSKYYWFTFVHRGVRYQESTKLTNKRKAGEFASAFRTRLIEGELNIKRKKPAPPFTEAMASYLEEVRGEHADHPRTVARYEHAAKPLLAYFGSKPLHQISTEEIARYRARRIKKLKPATVNLEVQGIITGDPVLVN